MKKDAMKKLAFLSAIFLSTAAYAGDDAVDCSKKNDGSVKCEVKKDQVVVDAISVNGGDCDVSGGDKVLHHPYKLGEKFTVPVKRSGFLPGLGGCTYVRAVTVQTSDGKSKTFAPL